MKTAGFVLGYLVLQVSACAAADSPSYPRTYSDAYIVEERPAYTSHWRVGAQYKHELSNSYLNVDALEVSAARSLSQFFHLGVAVTGYHATQTGLLQLTNDSLKEEGAKLTALKPITSAFTLVEAVPLSGQIDFFGNQPLEFELGVLVGPGIIHYNDGEFFAIHWAVVPSISLSSRVILELSIGQEIESPFSSIDRLSRLFGGIGLNVKL